MEKKKTEWLHVCSEISVETRIIKRKLFVETRNIKSKFSVKLGS